jgi:mitochondrial fission protein ELM1
VKKSKNNQPLKDEIWILSDNRAGTVSQSIGLALELGMSYKIIDLKYSFFSALPNWILSSSFLRISSKTKKIFEDLNYSPKLIISAGRRSAPIALHLKKLSHSQTKIVQIMNPNLNFKKFDFVILPKHDNLVGLTQFPIFRVIFRRFDLRAGKRIWTYVLASKSNQQQNYQKSGELRKSYTK